MLLKEKRKSLILRIYGNLAKYLDTVVESRDEVRASQRTPSTREMSRWREGRWPVRPTRHSSISTFSISPTRSTSQTDCLNQKFSNVLNRALSNPPRRQRAYQGPSCRSSTAGLRFVNARRVTERVGHPGSRNQEQYGCFVGIFP